MFSEIPKELLLKIFEELPNEAVNLGLTCKGFWAESPHQFEVIKGLFEDNNNTTFPIDNLNDLVEEYYPKLPLTVTQRAVLSLETYKRITQQVWTSRRDIFLHNTHFELKIFLCILPYMRNQEFADMTFSRKNCYAKFVEIWLKLGISYLNKSKRLGIENHKDKSCAPPVALCWLPEPDLESSRNSVLDVTRFLQDLARKMHIHHTQQVSFTDSPISHVGRDLDYEFSYDSKTNRLVIKQLPYDLTFLLRIMPMQLTSTTDLHVKN